MPRPSNIKEQRNAGSCNSRDVSFEAGEPNHSDASYSHPSLHQPCHAVHLCREFSPDWANQELTCQGDSHRVCWEIIRHVKCTRSISCLILERPLIAECKSRWAQKACWSELNATGISCEWTWDDNMDTIGFSHLAMGAWTWQPRARRHAHKVHQKDVRLLATFFLVVQEIYNAGKRFVVSSHKKNLSILCVTIIKLYSEVSLLHSSFSY